MDPQATQSYTWYIYTHLTKKSKNRKSKIENQKIENQKIENKTSKLEVDPPGIGEAVKQ